MVKKIKEKKFTSPTKQKVLLLLQAGLALSLTPSPRRQFWILKELSKEWKKIDRQYLYRIIREFKYDRLVDWKEKEDGSIEVVLTEKGKKHALRFNFEEMKIHEPNIWDGKWRGVFFDIPEKKRGIRDALRNKLRDLRFYELQKSVFVHPFPCKDEIDFIVEFFNARNFVRYADMINLTNDAQLKLHFDLD